MAETVRSIDPRTKIVFTLGVSLLSVTLDHPLSLGFLALLCLGAFLSIQPRAVHLKGALIFMGLTIWGIMFSQGIFYQRFPRTVLITLVPGFKILGLEFQGLNLYIQGIFYGLVQSLRFVSTMSAGLALCLSTSTHQLFRGLIGLKVPYGLAFLAMVALRFLPVITEEIKSVRAAMRLKGYSPFKSGMRHTLLTELSCVLPVLAGTVRRSKQMADALMTRGFHPTGKRTFYKMNPWPLGQRMAVLLFMLIASQAAIMRILFWLYEQNLCYISKLRPLYSMVRFYL